MEVIWRKVCCLSFRFQGFDISGSKTRKPLMAPVGYDAMVTVDMDNLDAFADTSEETRHLLRSLDEQGQLLPTMVETTNRAPQASIIEFTVIIMSYHIKSSHIS